MNFANICAVGYRGMYFQTFASAPAICWGFFMPEASLKNLLKIF
ncbi:hypothetical protein GCHA_1767 [Paraglaciecola chathamensis S18K6]|uniref:Uncharacterized protein n=2 Tax=Paraglaciecola chathamensis TaxID=368405 RepID=A0ABQ0IAF7_9ALTE|nr:hypothetical protein GAGA_3434 [Paraglaciecola agarilytica NO2]GAC09718.1 hypothetical protein GCHA_1767 [Paraglaciecola chathamensis S18K6]